MKDKTYVTPRPTVPENSKGGKNEKLSANPGANGSGDQKAG